MILRVTQKLGAKIKAGKLDNAPLDANPYADWSCHLFTANRAQYIKQGYQLLRIAPGLSASGCYWRCAITARCNILQSHGAKLRIRDFFLSLASKAIYLCHRQVTFKDAKTRDPPTVTQPQTRSTPLLSSA